MSAGQRPWGWHPLTDSWARRIVADARVRPGELVLDLGAGRGALTRHLVAAGARVVAVELHPGRARVLRERFAGQPVRVVEADLTELRLPRGRFRVVANPPYGVSSALLALLLAPDSRLAAADLVLQRGAALGFTERRHRLTRRAARTWDLEMGRALPRTAFVTAPAVESSVLVVRRRRGR